MRVAIVAPGYAPDPGGVETHVTRTAEGLAARGVDVQVWTQQRGRTSPATEQRAGVTVHRFPTTSSSRFPVSRALWRHVAQHGRDVDLVHAQSYHVTAALSALRVPRPTPVVLTPHYHGTGHTPLAKALHPAYRPLGARLVARSTALVAVSEAERALLASDFPASAARLAVVHNGADTALIAAAEPFPPDPPAVRSVPTVVVLGRLVAYKGAADVVRVFGRLFSPARLVVIGDGDDRDLVQRAADASPRAADITLAGRLLDDEVARWLRTAHVVISLSRQEAFGLVALEAAAGGARVVLSDLPAHREVAAMQGAEGTVLVPLDDEAAQLAALSSALEQPRPGPADVRSWEAVADDHLALYERVLARRPA